MPLPTPDNAEETSYLTLAMLSELIDVLISRQVIGDSDVAEMLGRVVDRLDAHPNFASKRTARFVAERMKIEE